MKETATLGGGCYWCLEAFYQRVRGVDAVTSGYSGGHVENPNAERVYQGDTGHAEVVQLIFDPKIISFREILEIFFVMHDPTTLNRQGYDVGEWYRSVIFYHDENQKKIAEETIENLPVIYIKIRLSLSCSNLKSFGRPKTTCRITTIEIRPPATAKS